MNLTVIMFEPYWLAFSILVIIWTYEHFFIQASLFSSPPITRHPLFFCLCRLGFNGLAAVFILALFSVPWIWGIFALDGVLSLVVIAYQKYFQKPLALFGALGNFREGIKVFPFAIRMVPAKAWILILLGIATKCYLAFVVSQAAFADEWRYGTAISATVLMAVMVLLLQKTSFRFISIRHTSMTRMVYVYGYLISWIADVVFSPSKKEIADELLSLQKDSPDRLGENAIPYEIKGHVVVIQLESLDWNILDHAINGKAVTPFLNQLSASSQVFKIAAYHEQATADMDYAVLSGGMPSTRMLSYTIPDLDYPNALPRFMGEHGFHTVALHGATGSFFNRRENFKKMDWDEIHFREEFQTMKAEESYWGTRDHEVFAYSANQLQQTKQREFHFIITLDSHGPFNLIKEEEKTIFPGSRNWKENYFNSMSALDENLRKYVNALPAGTLVVLYGDHTSGVKYQDFSPAREGNTEYVPCMVYQRPSSNLTDPNSSFKNQKSSIINRQSDFTRDLTIHDIVNCVRSRVKSR